MSQSNHWLNECLGEYKPHEGVHKLQSTVAWAAVLRFEIEEWHGSTADAQLDSCRRHFRAQQRKPGPPDKLGETYCGLYQALTSATTLVSLDCGLSGRLWMYPSAVVTWYYTHYQAFRAITFARHQNPKETHADLQKEISVMPRGFLPHPYNMRATFGNDGTFRITLPDAPKASRVRLVLEFAETSEMAQGMLLEYLHSTAKWKMKSVEDVIRDKDKLFPNFRTKAAKDVRNRRLKNETVNFMHCASRYRGNANYRDSLLLTYGTSVRKDYEQYLHNLAVSARFAFVCGFAFAEWAYGVETATHFLEDLERNFRGLASGTEAELFWRSFGIGAPQLR